MKMKCSVLFSGGKDSTYAAYLVKKYNYEISCLISIISENPESYMFHTPSILKVKKQAEVMNTPLIIQKTKGKKEEELRDLESAIKKAKSKYHIEAVVTGAVESAYQASRIQKICDILGLECFNPLWQKKPKEYWDDLLKNNFEIIITSVSAEGLSQELLGQKINREMISKLIEIERKNKIHLSFEGGEAETFVLNCPLFSKELVIRDKQISGKKNSWKVEIDIR
jgi:ABC transporter with metal-binding/Fe-S-binding domain ATP-binding protein